MSSTTAVIATQTPRGQWLSKAPGFAAVLTGSTTPNDSSQPVIAMESVDGAEHQNTKKLQAWTKFPDAAILFGDEESEPLLGVVFEAGFTESYDDLVSDAAQWLQKSCGKVRPAILMNIEEDVRSRRARQRSSEARNNTYSRFNCCVCGVCHCDISSGPRLVLLSHRPGKSPGGTDDVDRFICGLRVLFHHQE